MLEPKKGWKRIFDRDELEQLRTMIAAKGGKFGPKRNTKMGHEVFESLEAQLERARKAATDLA